MDVLWSPWRETAFSSLFSLHFLLYYCIINMANTRILPRFFVCTWENHPKHQVLNMGASQVGMLSCQWCLPAQESFLFQNVPGLSATTNPLACFFVVFSFFLFDFPTSYDLLTPTYFFLIYFIVCLLYTTTTTASQRQGFISVLFTAASHRTVPWCLESLNRNTRCLMVWTNGQTDVENIGYKCICSMMQILQKE